MPWIDRQTDYSVPGPLRVQTPALGTDSMVKTWKTRDQGPCSRSGCLFLYYTEMNRWPGALWYSPAPCLPGRRQGNSAGCVATNIRFDINLLPWVRNPGTRKSAS